jgi:hypothetical protein
MALTVNRVGLKTRRLFEKGEELIVGGEKQSRRGRRACCSALK